MNPVDARRDLGAEIRGVAGVATWSPAGMFTQHSEDKPGSIHNWQSAPGGLSGVLYRLCCGRGSGLYAQRRCRGLGLGSGWAQGSYRAAGGREKCHNIGVCREPLHARGRLLHGGDMLIHYRRPARLDALPSLLHDRGAVADRLLKGNQIVKVAHAGSDGEAGSVFALVGE